MSLLLVQSLIPASAVYNGSPALGDERVVLITGDMYGRLGCSGSLVAPRVVFTAGHCTDRANYVYPPNVTIGQGNTPLPTKVSRIFIPKEFNTCTNCGRGPIQDFAILILEKEIAKVPQMRVATLNEVTNLIENDVDVIQIGYGVKKWAPFNTGVDVLTNYPERLVSKLRKTSFLQNNLEEKALLADKPNIFINAVNSPEAVMCGGDSGSPLYFKDGADYVYVGALSSVTGLSCQYSKDDPMRTNPYWIERTLGVYYVAAYYQSTIEEAFNFAKSVEEKEKSDAAIKAKNEATAKLVKKVTITCIKGSSIKKVTGVKPFCPKGYKKR